jgi:phosphoesterase RecJ-like protein
MLEILKKIKEYQKIIIHRHSNPDLDALGSQIGLKETLKLNFPEKEIYAVGDMNRFTFLGEMDNVDDNVFKDALCIICDVAVSHMISDYRYFDAKEVIVIDHHQNETNLSLPDKEFNLPLYRYVDTKSAACCAIVADMISKWNLEMPSFAATALYGGIVTDSGRFQYGVNLAPLFRTSAYLVENGADPQFIYRNLYVESLESRIMKNYFQTKMQLTKNNVAYMFNDKDVFEKFDVDTFTVSRGMVNLMAGIDKVKIWANFTYDRATGKVFGEFRSRDIVIVDIAKQFGGGGHANACGATLDDFEVAKEVLECFDKLLEEIENV